MTKRIHRQPLHLRMIRQGMGIVLGVVATVSIAHAHGGMAGPDDLGPPLFTSAALAFICYWVVILWPAAKRKASDDAPGGRKLPVKEDSRLGKRASKRIVAGRTSQLRRVQNSRASSVSGSGRKATDV